MQTRRGSLLFLSFALSTALTTPGFAQTPVPKAGTPAAAESLESRLLREVGAGASVAIVPGKEGLRAISSDGLRQRVLIPGEVPWALVDNRGQAVWFKKGDGAALWLLDLTRPEPAAEIVVNGVKGFDIALAYPGNGTERLHSYISIYDGAIEIQVADRPSLKKLTGVYGEIFLDQERQRVRTFQKNCRLTPAGRTLLQQLARRGQGRSLTRPLPKAETLPPVSTVPASGCEETKMCGGAEAIPGTKLWRVVVSHACGDACQGQYQLYDPQAKQFVRAADQSQRSAAPRKTDEPSLNELYVAPDGRALLTPGYLLRIGGKAIPTSELSVGGWLGSAWHVL